MIYCFLVPPTITIAPDNQTVKEDEPVYLHCKAVSTPAAKISWTKDNDPVRDDVTGYTLFPNGTFFIAKAKPSDSGTYKCLARNPVSWTADADAKLVVMCEFIIGGFDCENSGLLCLVKLPIPMFKWRLKGLNLHFVRN